MGDKLILAKSPIIDIDKGPRRKKSQRLNDYEDLFIKNNETGQQEITTFQKNKISTTIINLSEWKYENTIFRDRYRRKIKQYKKIARERYLLQK